MKCYICKKNLGKEAKEMLTVQIGSKNEIRYIHKRECNRANKEEKE